MSEPKVLSCISCGHSWTSKRTGLPVRCVNRKCQTIFWMEERKPFSVELIRNPPETDDCIEWQGCRFKGMRQYGQVRYKRKAWTAHRLSYQLNVGPVPKHLDVCHQCDNPPCYNPRHLFLGTRLENMRDCAVKGRVAKQPGEMAGRSILNECQVAEIRAKHKPLVRGYGMKTLAKEYGVGASTIRAIIGRTTWKEI